MGLTTVELSIEPTFPANLLSVSPDNSLAFNCLFCQRVGYVEEISNSPFSGTFCFLPSVGSLGLVKTECSKIVQSERALNTNFHKRGEYILDFLVLSYGLAFYWRVAYLLFGNITINIL